MADTLRSICEQCSHVKNPQLDFIPDSLARRKEIIARDLGELVSAASIQLPKVVVILAGSIFESLLYSFIQANEAYIAERRGEFTFDPQHSLQNYIDIFNRWFSDRLPLARLSDVIADYRDLVHINRELDLPPDGLAEVAQTMLETLNNLLRELSKFAGHT